MDTIIAILQELIVTGIYVAPSVIAIVLIVKIVKRNRYLSKKAKTESIEKELEEIEKSLKQMRESEETNGKITPIWKEKQ